VAGDEEFLLEAVKEAAKFSRLTPKPQMEESSRLMAAHALHGSMEDDDEDREGGRDGLRIRVALAAIAVLALPSSDTSLQSVFIIQDSTPR
jgi:hypothetical protein